MTDQRRAEPTTRAPERLRVLIKEAARAHTNLNTFASVVSLLEGGHVYGYQREADQIIRICNRAQQRFLDQYDRAAARIAKELAA